MRFSHVKLLRMGHSHLLPTRTPRSIHHHSLWGGGAGSSRGGLSLPPDLTHVHTHADTHTHTEIHVCTHRHTCTQRDTHAHRDARAHACTLTHVYTKRHTREHRYIGMQTHACTHRYTCTHTCTQRHACTQTCTHACTQTHVYTETHMCMHRHTCRCTQKHTQHTRKQKRTRTQSCRHTRAQRSLEMKTPPLTSQMEINGFEVDIPQLSENIKNTICYEPPLSPLNFCACEKCFMDCCPDTGISYLLRPSLVTPAGAGEDKPSLALTPCSLLQPLPHPAPRLGTQRAHRDTQTDPQRTQLNVKRDPEGVSAEVVGPQEDRGTGKPPRSKDSTPPTDSTSSFPLGAKAETWAILLPASCTGHWETSPPAA